MIAIELNEDSTVGQLRELLGKVRNPQGMLRTVAKRAEDELKAHFRHRDQDPSIKHGGMRTHFWRQVEKSVVVTISEADGEIQLKVTHPHFAQKVFGGRIEAKNALALTIPVSPEAYGKMTREFETKTGLRLFLIKPNGKGMLATRVKGARAIEVHYLLRRSVEQDAEMEAMPDMDALGAAIMSTAREELERN